MRLPCPHAPLLLAGLLFSPAVAAEPPNLDPAKQAVIAYVESGDYDRDLARVAAAADAWLRERAPRGGGRLALVLDVDETLLSNLPHLRAVDFGYVPAAWDRWVQAGAAPAIKPVCALLVTARELGLAVIIISGRAEHNRSDTERNLRAVGAGAYAALHLKADDSHESTGAYKTAWRRRLTEEGWVIIANVGDQDSDLEGGYAERTFKLPDPFYLTK